jgi:hypothetical protein
MGDDKHYAKGRADRSAGNSCNVPYSPMIWHSDEEADRMKRANERYREGWHDKDREIRDRKK